MSNDDQPLLVFHGTRDRTVLIDQSKAIETKYKEAGLSIWFYTIEGAGHGGNAFYKDENAKRLITFLAEQMKSKTN